MATRLLIVSGGIACGKSQLARGLQEAFGCNVMRTADLIRQLRPTVGGNRDELQRAGNNLDRGTSYQWIGNEAARYLRNVGRGETPLVLDGVRKPGQVKAIQEAIGHRYVRHVHLTAGLETRKARYQEASRAKDQGMSFEEAIGDVSERSVKALSRLADVVIETGRCTPRDVLARVSARIGLQSRSANRVVDVVIGGQYGSEGKGNIADYLSPEYGVLMRVGGPNAGHIVYEDPPYTHVSLPCGTRRNPDAHLLIGPGAVVHPKTLIREIRECEVEPGRLTLDEHAVLVEDGDIEWERTNLAAGIGSTAQGAGMAAARRIRDRFRDHRQCGLAKDAAGRCRELVPYVGSTGEALEAAYTRGTKILVEGTQGTGLSLFHGEYPSVTSRDTSVAGCLSEAGIGPRRVNRIVMVCRTYPIRVGGNSGSLPVEINWEEIARRSGIDIDELKGHEIGSRSRKPRRVAEFDWSILRKACQLNTPTDIALTFVDYLNVRNRRAVRFEDLTTSTINFVEEVELVSGVPCSLVANRFDYKCVIDRRRW